MYGSSVVSRTRVSGRAIPDVTWVVSLPLAGSCVVSLWYHTQACTQSSSISAAKKKRCELELNHVIDGINSEGWFRFALLEDHAVAQMCT